MSSLTLNMVGGGGGGLSATDALLRVQAPAGSTVTITKGTTTKTDHGHENAYDHTVYDYYFIIHQSQFDSINPWTVTATLNGQTTSDTVIIDAADEYDVSLYYTFWIYKDGVQGVPLEKRTFYQYNAGTVTFGASNITLSYSGSTNNVSCAFGSVSTVDLTKYSTLYLKVNVTSRPTSNTYNRFGLFSTYNVGDSSSFLATQEKNGSDLIVGTNTFVVDISSVTTASYVYAYFNKLSGSSSFSATVSKIWAEV